MNPKFVKIILRDKSSFTLLLEKVETILKSGVQIVMLEGEDGKWGGEAFNKADIVRTERDYGEEKDWRQKNIKEIESSKTPLDITKFKPKSLE